MTDGVASVIFASPESLLDGAQWAMTAVKSHRERVCLLALDEVHCLSEWCVCSIKLNSDFIVFVQENAES